MGLSLKRIWLKHFLLNEGALTFFQRILTPVQKEAYDNGCGDTGDEHLKTISTESTDCGTEGDNEEAIPRCEKKQCRPPAKRGPHVSPATQASALDLFELFFDSSIMERILQCTYNMQNSRRKANEEGTSYL